VGWGGRQQSKKRVIRSLAISDRWHFHQADPDTVNALLIGTGRDRVPDDESGWHQYSGVHPHSEPVRGAKGLVVA
jgi:hypothetical protein